MYYVATSSFQHLNRLYKMAKNNLFISTKQNYYYRKSTIYIFKDIYNPDFTLLISAIYGILGFCRRSGM